MAHWPFGPAKPFKYLMAFGIKVTTRKTSRCPRRRPLPLVAATSRGARANRWPRSPAWTSTHTIWPTETRWLGDRTTGISRRTCIRRSAGLAGFIAARPGRRGSSDRDINAYNLAYRAPLAWGSDNWDFPTNLYPTVGWIGRVHRGTPWQAVDLKSTNILFGKNSSRQKD